MNRRGSSLFFLILLSAAFAVAGDLQVSGEVTGTWTAGTHVVVTGPVTVPASGSLTIEPAVTITINTESPFIVDGDFHASGNADNPIIIQPLTEWEGFSFGPFPGERELEWVRIDTSLALPARIVVSRSSDISIASCVFFAQRSAVEVYGGHVQLRSSFLLSRARFSKTIILEDLAGQERPAPPCDPGSNSSRVTDNVAIARVEFDSENVTYPRDAFTSAMVVERSTNLCLEGNTFTVEAPWTCIGVHFGTLPESGDPVWSLRYCTVAVRSFDGMPLGVNKANEGYLLAVRCNIDVGKIDENNYYTSTGVRASHDAQILLNSSTLTLDEGNNFFMSVSGGLLTVDYNTSWTIGSAGPNGGPSNDDLEALDAEMLDSDDPPHGVILGPHNLHANPRFAMEGAWGRWQSKNDVRRYYSLMADSPCIDAGDTLYSHDSDGTLPDIGHFPYEEMSVGDPREQPLLPADATVGPAFPNPFNLNTTVPFELRRGGLVTFIVHDVLGRVMAREVIGPLGIGRHEIVWDATNAGSGTYFLTIGLSGVWIKSQQVYLLK